jgi:hypothetical protein
MSQIGTQNLSSLLQGFKQLREERNPTQCRECVRLVFGSLTHSLPGLGLNDHFHFCHTEGSTRSSA